jgi:hypothetical protein
MGEVVELVLGDVQRTRKLEMGSAVKRVPSTVPWLGAAVVMRMLVHTVREREMYWEEIELTERQ